ncbi:hypothetical protein GCM10028805_31320 [Spirosoma harenae]
MAFVPQNYVLFESGVKETQAYSRKSLSVLRQLILERWLELGQNKAPLAELP